MKLLRFSSTREIVALTLVWTAALFAIDYAKNPRPLSALMGRKQALDAEHAITTPRVTLWLNHMCCSGCLDDLKKGLAALPWVGRVEHSGETVLLSQMQSNELAEPAIRNGAGRVVIDLKTLDAVDFVTLDEAIRKVGFVAERMEVSGIPHFRLEAEMHHVCCKACSIALTDGLDIAKRLHANGGFNWFDSATASPERRSVAVYAKYNSAVDVTELIGALNHIGLSPLALRLRIGD